MKSLRLKALALGATEVLSRSQMKNVLGGSAPDPGNDECGNPKDGCFTTSCTIKGGTCDGKAGTCGGKSKCTCAGGC